MQTQVVRFDEATALILAIEYLKRGECVVLPTDTVYGLMCCFDQPAAIEKLYEIKGRPPMKAIPVLIGEMTQIAYLSPMPMSPVAAALMAQFWPGPLTIILPALSTLPGILTANQPTVAVRQPAHKRLTELLIAIGPLAATSANLSGHPETQTTTAVLAQLQGRFPLLLSDPIMDVRPQPGVASTIVALDQMTEKGPYLIREGPLGKELRQFLWEQLGISCG